MQNLFMKESMNYYRRKSMNQCALNTVVLISKSKEKEP